MTPPDLHHIPERAITAFEKTTGLCVTVHDLDGTLWPFLQPERFRHRSPCCAAVKATHEWACVDFEVTRLRADLAKTPEGRCHQCHAGFVEWVAPVVRSDRLAWVIFAGQRVAHGRFRELSCDVRKTHAPYEATARPRKITEREADDVLEMLRQLRARLTGWHEMLTASLPGGRAQAPVQAASREWQIQRFLHDRHRGEASVADLARELGLGESRAMHLTKEIFGCSFVQLLQDMRLRTAASLLRDTSVPILEVCADSGFRDVSHFHRLFRRRFGMTPLHYRHTAAT